MDAKSEKMKVLLIDPPYSRFMKYYRYFYPVGLTYLAGALKKEGHSVKTYDCEHDPLLTTSKFQDIASNYDGYMKALENKNHPVWREIRSTIASVKPDVIGISSIAPCKIGSTFKVAELAKEYDKDAKVVVGGHLSAESVNDVLRNPNVDVVVRGEGEITVAELVNQFEKGGELEQVAGISFKQNGQIVCTPDRPFIEDLDALSFPYIESLIGLETYRPVDLGIVMSSRGCVFQCTFCGLKEFWGKRTRWRSLENVIEEIQRLREKFRVTYISFWDAVFTLNRKRTLQLCNKFLEMDPEIKWECVTRIDLLDSELLSNMKKAGCKKIRIGIESGSDRILKSFKKNLSIEVVKKQAPILKASKIPWLAYFMFGAPDEEEEDMLATMNLIKEVSPNFVTVGTFYPIPGTEVYCELQSRGELPKGTDYNKLSTRVLSTHYMRHVSLKRYQQIMKQVVTLTEKINKGHYSDDPLFSDKLTLKQIQVASKAKPQNTLEPSLGNTLSMLGRRFSETNRIN